MLDDGASVKRGQERYGRLSVIRNVDTKPKQDPKVDAEVEAIAREPGSEIFPNDSELQYLEEELKVFKKNDPDDVSGKQKKLKEKIAALKAKHY